jgi:hypothetical protein
MAGGIAALRVRAHAAHVHAGSVELVAHATRAPHAGVVFFHQTRVDVAAGEPQKPSFFCFLALFFEKILLNRPLAERFQKMDPQLGAIVDGAKI